MATALAFGDGDDEQSRAAALLISAATAMCALAAADLPRATYDRFCFGGADFKKCFLLDEQDRLSELADERE